jgi:hypothetical protein
LFLVLLPIVYPIEISGELNSDEPWKYSFEDNTYTLSLHEAIVRYEWAACSFIVKREGITSYGGSTFGAGGWEYLFDGDSYSWEADPKITFKVNKCEIVNSEDVYNLYVEVSFTFTVESDDVEIVKCNPECTNHDEKWCEGNNIHYCFKNSEGCWVDKSIHTCPTSLDQKCLGGECIFECEDECNSEGLSCIGNDVFKCSDTDGDGCKDYTYIKYCGNGMSCQSGICIDKPECEEDSDCKSNQQCSRGNCILKGGCKYGNPSCGRGDKCENNKCVPIVLPVNSKHE